MRASAALYDTGMWGGVANFSAESSPSVLKNTFVDGRKASKVPSSQNCSFTDSAIDRVTITPHGRFNKRP
jgi:hypothetical protein